MSEPLSERLRSVASAYPEDIFPPFTDDERRANSVIISRASGNMGRFLSKHMLEAADLIDALVEALGRWEAAYQTGRHEPLVIAREAAAQSLVKMRRMVDAALIDAGPKPTPSRQAADTAP